MRLFANTVLNVAEFRATINMRHADPFGLRRLATNSLKCRNGADARIDN
jgi:hypothetical protein